VWNRVVEMVQAGDRCTIRDVRRRAGPVGVQIIDALRSRLLVAELDLRGQFLPFPAVVDLARQDLVMACPVFPPLLVDRFNKWAKLCRVAVEVLHRLHLPVTTTSLAESISVASRRRLGHEVTPFLIFLDAHRLLDQAGHLVEMDLFALVEIARLHFIDLANQRI
jgi:hypothetical protein